jgi:D-glycero-D-manno-heptose 1,7-bisphosphate phosphatase
MKLIIVERDGIVDDRKSTTPEAWRPIPGSAAALARLVHAGYRVVVMADQTALARGIFDMSTLNEAHRRMIAGVEQAGGRIDAVFFRPSEDAGNGDVGAAALRAVLDRLKVAPDQVLVVGDSIRELDAAVRAGCRPVLVLTGSGRRTLETGELPPGTLVRVDLSAVASDLAC